MTKKIIKVLIAYIIMIFLLLLVIFLLELVNYKCPINYLFHIKCSGCGTTRMLKAILNLEFREAFNYNQAMFILSPFIISYIIYNSYLYIIGKKLRKVSLKSITIILIYLLAFMITRNVF